MIIKNFGKSCFLASSPGGVYREWVVRYGLLAILFFPSGLVCLLFTNFEHVASLLLLSEIDLFSACFLTSIGELSLVIPVVCYSNADTQKTSILKENRGRSGVYR